MNDIPDSVVHWLLGATVPAGGGLFLWLLKRTFNDFEVKIAKLFAHMEKSLTAQQDHDTRIQLMDQRLTFIERYNERVSERCEVHRAARPAED